MIVLDLIRDYTLPILADSRLLVPDLLERRTLIG
jgi:hypothetical protein